MEDVTQEPSGAGDEPRDVRRLLHDVNDELSIAVLQLELMLEAGVDDRDVRESLEESLDACRRAAVSLRAVWSILGPSG